MSSLGQTVRTGWTGSTDASLRIAWAPFAHPDAPFGYGIIAAKLREALQSAGAKMLPSTSFGWDGVVAVSLPAAWPVNGTGQRRDLVWHTMFELEPLPPGWADVLNRSAGVWVPSNWCAELFRANGVKVPIFVTGYGVDPNVFYPIDRSGRDGPLRVLVWSQMLVGRKNPLMALRAFIKAAFPVDEAEIEIKVNAGNGQEGVKGADGAYLSNARVIAADWQRSQLGDWLRSGDVLVYLSGGEGFGLMPLEAMATGLPVICANNTGMTDYLTPYNSMPVRSVGKRKSAGYSLRFGVDCYEEIPDQAMTTDYLRWCFEHREDAYRIGQRGAETAATWTWEETGRRALVQLSKIFSTGQAESMTSVTQ